MSKIGLFILVIFCSDVLTLIDDNFNEFSNTKRSRSNLGEKRDKIDDVDLEKRKEIVRNYMETLSKTEDKWVDPYDMLSHDESQSLPSRVSEEPNIDNEFEPVFSDIRGEVIGSNSIPKDETDAVIKNSVKLFSNPRHQISVLDSIYISRWLKMLIMKIETDSYFEPSELVIPFNSDSLSELKTISTKTINIGELDELVSNLISKATVTSKETYGWATFFSSNFGFGVLLVTALGLVAYFFYIFMIVRPIWTIFWILIFICIFWHWMHLYQKQVAHKHAQLHSMQVPSECRKNDFSLFESIGEFIKGFFRVSDCTKYYEALMVDPFWEVSLSVAFSETVSAMLFQPLYTGSKALNACIKLLFDGLPFTSIVLIVVLLFVLIIMYFKYRIKLPFFMGVLEPVCTQRKYVEDVKPYKGFDAISDLIQKSAATIENADRKMSALFQDKLLHKNPNSNSTESIENAIPKKLVDCYGAFKLTCKECEKSLKLASDEFLTDQVSKVGGEIVRYNFGKKHCGVNDDSLFIKNSVENDICDKCDNLSLSNDSEPNEVTDDKCVENSCSACECDNLLNDNEPNEVAVDKCVENSCSACESNQQKPSICCGMSEQNSV